MATEYLERELTFEVDDAFTLPDVSRIVPDGGHVAEETVTLRSTYWDTASTDLLRLGITLRRRTGGTDAGWHLKLPEKGARVEMRRRSRTAAVPEELAAAVSVVAGAEIEPVATVTTERRVVRVHDADGGVLVELADDRVVGTPGQEQDAERRWREVEAELGTGDEELLSRMTDLLTAAGARPAVVTSKLRRVLGADEGQAPEPETVGDLVGAYLGDQVRALLVGDVGLRLGRAVVHPTRVATRRTRSTLRVFAEVMDPDRAELLDRELRWFADLLGQVRDRDVLRRHLDAAVTALPAELVLGPVAARIDSELLAQRSAAAADLAAAMDGERYRALVADLKAWAEHPPLTAGAASGAEEAWTYVRSARRKARKRLRRAGGDPDALHRARKATKRARYAAELARPALGGQARRVVKRARRLQATLGEHQDAVVAAAFLRDLGARVGGGENGFTYGVLLERENRRAQDVREALE